MRRDSDMALFKYFSRVPTLPAKVPSLSEKELERTNAEIFLGTWPTMVSPRMTATAYRSLSLPVSRLHGNSSPTLGVRVSL